MGFLDLLPAIYKNIPFFVKKEQIDSVGHKRVIHTYPNTSVVYAEAQGVAPTSFTIDIFFHGPTAYLDFQAFKNALEDPLPGRLFLPSFGVFNNVIVVPSSAEVDQTTVGIISFPSVQFYVTMPRPSPTQTLTTQEDVFFAGESIRQAISAAALILYTVPSTINNVKTIILDSMSLVQSVFIYIQNQLLFANIINNLPKKIQNPGLLMNYLLNPNNGVLEQIAFSVNDFKIFTSISTIGNNLSNELIDIFYNFAPKSSSMDHSRILNIFTINVWDNNTIERQERNNNRYLICNIFRLVGLVGMMEQASSQNYNSTNDIDNTSKTLHTYYERLIENDTTGIIIPQVKSMLDDMKGKTFDVLRQKKQSANNIVDIRIDMPIPASLLTYNLYAEYIKNENDLNTLSNIIIGLNPSQPAHFMQGDINILEVT
jgi:prophage DNA circulation protein